MFTYVSRSLLSIMPTLLGVLTITFLLTRVIPGDPVIAIIGSHTAASAVDIELLRERLGLDKPIYVQYVVYVGQVLRGDFGVSLRTEVPVFESILRVFPYTLELVVAAMVIAILIGVPLGVAAAVGRNTLVDYVSMVISLIGMCTPVFFLALVLMMILSVRLQLLPVLGVGTQGDLLSQLRHLALPALALGLVIAAIVARMCRSSMLEVLGQDYICTARAKGLAEWAVNYRHALKNALLPVVTVIGTEMGRFLGGTVVLEIVFARPGLGKLLVDSIANRDYPVAQGGIVFFAMVVIVVHVCIDLCYMWIDPRIRYGYD